ncbi:hypothetical protein KEM56_003759, partial [Ascosphaera pollenicola]
CGRRTKKEATGQKRKRHAHLIDNAVPPPECRTKEQKEAWQREASGVSKACLAAYQELLKNGTLAQGRIPKVFPGSPGLKVEPLPTLRPNDCTSEEWEEWPFDKSPTDGPGKPPLEGEVTHAPPVPPEFRYDPKPRPPEKGSNTQTQAKRSLSQTDTADRTSKRYKTVQITQTLQGLMKISPGLYRQGVPTATSAPQPGNTDILYTTQPSLNTPAASTTFGARYPGQGARPAALPLEDMDFATLCRNYGMGYAVGPYLPSRSANANPNLTQLTQYPHNPRAPNDFATPAQYGYGNPQRMAETNPSTYPQPQAFPPQTTNTYAGRLPGPPPVSVDPTLTNTLPNQGGPGQYGTGPVSNSQPEAPYVHASYAPLDGEFPQQYESLAGLDSAILAESSNLGVSQHHNSESVRIPQTEALDPSMANPSNSSFDQGVSQQSNWEPMPAPQIETLDPSISNPSVAQGVSQQRASEPIADPQTEAPDSNSIDTLVYEALQQFESGDGAQLAQSTSMDCTQEEADQPMFLEDDPFDEYGFTSSTGDYTSQGQQNDVQVTDSTHDAFAHSSSGNGNDQTPQNDGQTTSHTQETSASTNTDNGNHQVQHTGGDLHHGNTQASRELASNQDGVIGNVEGNAAAANPQAGNLTPENLPNPENPQWQDGPTDPFPGPLPLDNSINKSGQMSEDKYISEAVRQQLQHQQQQYENIQMLTVDPANLTIMPTTPSPFPLPLPLLDDDLDIDFNTEGSSSLETPSPPLRSEIYNSGFSERFHPMFPKMPDYTAEHRAGRGFCDGETPLVSPMGTVFPFEMEEIDMW